MSQQPESGRSRPAYSATISTEKLSMRLLLRWLVLHGETVSQDTPVQVVRRADGSTFLRLTG